MNASLLFSPLIALLLCACGDEKIQTRQVPQASGVAQKKEMGGGNFSVELPTGWSERPASGIRVASYAIDGSSLDLYWVVLSNGNVPANVNRWRGQLGLSPRSADAIRREVHLFDLSGREACWLTLENPDSGAGFFGAIVDCEPEYWYFVARGPMDEIQAHQSELLTFIHSFRCKTDPAD